MKLLVIILVFIFAAILGAVTNPGINEFNSWYSTNVENPMRDALYKQVDDSLKTDNDILNVLVNGAYQLLAKKDVDLYVNNYLQNLRNKVVVKRYIFYTEYDIYFPNSNALTVYGYLNSIHEKS